MQAPFSGQVPERRHNQGGMRSTHQVRGTASGRRRWFDASVGCSCVVLRSPWQAWLAHAVFSGGYWAVLSEEAPPSPARVELVDRLTGRLVPQHDPLGLQVRGGNSAVVAGGRLAGCGAAAPELHQSPANPAQRCRCSPGLQTRTASPTPQLTPALRPHTSMPAAVCGGWAGAREPAGGRRRHSGSRR